MVEKMRVRRMDEGSEPASTFEPIVRRVLPATWTPPEVDDP